MSTTALFVDYLIIGVQTTLGVLLLFLTVFGFPAIDPAVMKGWEPVIGLAALAVVYPLGVFVDHIADTLLSYFARVIRKAHLKDTDGTVLDLLMSAKDSKLSSFYEGLRVRIRISRSSFLNFLFLATVLPFFGHFRLAERTDQAWAITVATTVSCFLVALAALKTWADQTNNFFRRAVEARQTVERLKAEGSGVLSSADSLLSAPSPTDSLVPLGAPPKADD